LLKDLTKEELVKKMVSVEFNRFLNYYKKKRDLVADSKGGNVSHEEVGDTVRYFVNIGSRDQYDWMTLKDFLREQLQVGRDDVFKVDVKEGFSFFNTNREHLDTVMGKLNGMELDGRRINVEISKNDGGRNNNRRDHNGREAKKYSGGGGRSGGGRDFNRRSDKPRGDRKEGNFPGKRSFEEAKNRRSRRS
jgi:ATP-dependent RNA helicase DeaD